MTNPSVEHRFFHRRAILLFSIVILAGSLYFIRVPTDPPGFYIDESSIAYNAHLISQTGRDEYNETCPLYFRAFGDYKNPVFIYLLAAVFRVTGPSILVARLLCAALGVLAAALLGLLAWQMAHRLSVGLMVGLSALFTPWLFESSRLVFEVALYPTLTALFLIALWRSAARARWNVTDVLSLSLALALLTYSYSIGRLLAPLLAFGLVFFITRLRWKGVVATWIAYAISLLPLLIFNMRHPGALNARFNLLTYITPGSSVTEISLTFLRHFVANINPWRWLVTGENNVRDNFAGQGSLLIVTVLLGLFGVVVVLLYERRDAWWRFILYGLIVSVVPASLTTNEFPQLRLIAFPVFFHVLIVPALRRLIDVDVQSKQARLTRQIVVVLLVGGLIAQGIFFQWTFHKIAPDLWYVFDARFRRKVLATALATGKRPIYLVDPPGKSGYIQGLWYGTLQGVSSDTFIRSSPDSVPPGAMVIATEEDCLNCTLIAKSINYTVYAVLPNDIHVSVPSLPPEAFRAHIIAEKLPTTLKAGAHAEIDVQVKNLSTASWPAVGEADGRQAVKLHVRWLRPDGTLVSDDGGSRLPYDLEPGDTAGLTLKITAPSVPGQYVLELDMVQENVATFGSQGSETLRSAVKVYE